MKIKILLPVLAILLKLNAFSQRAGIELTFTAIDSVTNVQLDSVKIMNRTAGNQSVIYWPDTNIFLEIASGDTLLYIGYATFYPVGVQEINQESEQFHLFQNYPNPVIDQSMVSMYIPEKGLVNILLTDIQGRVILSSDWQLDRGKHTFRFIPADGRLFFLTASWNGVSKNIKMLATGQHAGQRCILDYQGSSQGDILLKASSQTSNFIIKESGILDDPAGDKTYTFQFTDNTPCPGTPTVLYQGQLYNTVQILSQCWLKENLNVGTMIDGGSFMLDNGIIEKYCYNNDPDSCSKYGGLYQWEEMMQYTAQQGVQGICPPGWHLPTDEEWKVLEGAVDSQYGIGDPIWDLTGHMDRGFDAGINLKTTTGWYCGGSGSDLFGFSGMPSGHLVYPNYFILNTKSSTWWTSTEDDIYEAWFRGLNFGWPTKVERSTLDKWIISLSVRCLQD